VARTKHSNSEKIKNRETCGDYGGVCRTSGRPCRNPAGLRATNDSGRCFLHGGCAVGPRVKNGKYAVKARNDFQKKILEQLKDPSPMELESEMALLRALVDHLLEEMARQEEEQQRLIDDNVPSEERLERQDIITQHIGAITTVISEIRKVVDTVSKVQSREMLTATESAFMIAVLASVLREEIDDPGTLENIFTKYERRLKLPQVIQGTLITE
jgi:hypothetical protein